MNRVLREIAGIVGGVRSPCSNTLRQFITPLILPIMNCIDLSICFQWQLSCLVALRITVIAHVFPLSEITTGRESDLYFLDLTLALAAKGEDQVRPNPLVGAVVVKNGIVVGQGFHRYEGVKHAEGLALEEAGTLARGATVYVNLEPCCHRGNGKSTPPCCDALIAAGVKRVVCCITDPNPRVNGRGVAALRKAGIAVTVGARTSAARLLNAEYLRSMIVSNTSPSLALMELLF